MAPALRPIGHEDRLSIVEHLDELRSRLIICGITLVVAFGLCFWQNQPLLKVLNRALPHTSSTEVQHGLAGVPAQTARERRYMLAVATDYRKLASIPGTSSAAGQVDLQLAADETRAANSLATSASASGQEKPITIGVGEPFVTTLTVCGYFALLFTLPLLLYQATPS